MRLNILFLCNKPDSAVDANTIIDHISAFENYSQHAVFTYSNVGDISPQIELAKFDAIVIHYSLSLVNDYYISQQSKAILRHYSGLKIMFIQDEYRQINKIISEIDYLKMDVLFTCFPQEEMGRIYCPSKLPLLSKYNNLTGYIPERLLAHSPQLLKPIAEREIDVGYRSRKLPFWLGQLSYEKWHIVEQWNQYVNDDNGLKTNISYNETDRIYGENWIRFLLSCKTTLGVESGASVMDFTGQLQTLIDYHQATYPDDSFEKIHNMYLQRYENQYKLNQISPRCFEAIALKTVLVLYEGEYSGILFPEKHYIPLKKNFSNIAEVISKIKDVNYLQRMADNAYNEIALNNEYHYSTFVKRFDELATKEFGLRDKKQVIQPYSPREFQESLIIRKEEKANIAPADVNKSSHTIKKPANLSMNRLDKFNIKILKLVKHILTKRVIIFNPFLRILKRYILEII